MKVSATQPFVTQVNGRPASFQVGPPYDLDDATATRLMGAGLLVEYVDPATAPSPASPPSAEEPDKAAKGRATKRVGAAPENKAEPDPEPEPEPAPEPEPESSE